MRVTTPISLTPEIRRFCRKIVSDQDPWFVPVHPVSGAKPSECFNNVDRQVERAGGVRRLGWAVWIMPRLMIEAEFHAVWQTLAGTLQDVTPHTTGERRILFLSDPRASYSGEAPDNIRHALVDHPLVHEFIRRGRVRYELLRGHPPGEVRLPADVVRKALPNPAAFSQAFEAFARAQLGRNDPCYCGSGLKLKNCCG